MNVALEINNTYENFELAKDILYFRVGDKGLVSFHGKNYHIKKRLSSEQMNELLSDKFFFKANTDCYVNLKRIMRIQDGRVYFEKKGTESRYTTITKLRQYRLKEIWQQHQKPRESND